MPQPFPTPPTVVILGGDSLQVRIHCPAPSSPERPTPINRLRRYGLGSPACVIQTRNQHGRLLCQVVVAQQ